MGSPYLISAYAFTALLFGLYAWSIARRKARLLRELEDLRKKVSGQ
ncbi:MAG: heme exporter protein CcmD [Acidobacteria bacterium]|nr:heme exporter protein CcmD [Acidobacteriota bacterium]